MYIYPVSFFNHELIPILYTVLFLVIVIISCLELAPTLITPANEALADNFISSCASCNILRAIPSPIMALMHRRIP